MPYRNGGNMVTKKHQTDSKQQKKEKQPPLSEIPRNSVDKADEGKRTEHDSENIQKPFSNFPASFRRFVKDYAIIILTAGLVYVNFKLVDYNAAQTKANIRMAAVAESSFVIARESFNITKEEMIVSGAPYFSVQFNVDTLIVGKHIMVSLYFTNSGHTPAIAFKSIARLAKRFPDQIDYMKPIPGNLPVGRAIVAPNGSQSTTLQSSFVLTQEDANAIGAGNQILLIQSIIEYGDVFKQHHRVTYSEVYIPKAGDFGMTENGNDYETY
jgi:hypothetical protein